jgi:hypothetical protein
LKTKSGFPVKSVTFRRHPLIRLRIRKDRNRCSVVRLPADFIALMFLERVLQGLENDGSAMKTYKKRTFAGPLGAARSLKPKGT